MSRDKVTNIDLLNKINEHNTDAVQRLARIEEKLEALTGPEGRVTRLERSNVRQWWISVGVAPVVAVLHAVARKFGANV